QRLQGTMGDVHPTRLRGRPLQTHAAGRCQGCSARGMRVAKLARTALDRRHSDQGVRVKTHMQTGLATTLAVTKIAAEGGSPAFPPKLTAPMLVGAEPRCPSTAATFAIERDPGERSR